MLERYQVVVATADVAIGYWSGLAMTVWTGTTWPHLPASMKTAVDGAHASSASGKVLLVQIVTPDAVVPDTRSRAAVANMLYSVDGIVSHSAVVYVGSGFRASIVRSIVTAVIALGRHSFPHKVFATIQEAVAWFGRDGLEDQTGTQRKISLFYQAAISGKLRTEQKRRAAGEP